MPSVEYLRDFVSERLTAAAEEIFGVFKQTIVEYEEELDRQRRLLGNVRKPETRLNTTGVQNLFSLITQKQIRLIYMCCSNFVILLFPITLVVCYARAPTATSL